MRTLMRPALLAIVLVLALAATAQAGIVSNTKDFHQVDSGWVQCANGGAGELVLIDGYIHEVITYTEPSHGRATLTLHYAPAGLIGIGQTTGDVYRAPGRVQLISASIVGDNSGDYVATTNLRFPLIGPGPSNDSWYQLTAHFTITPDGVVTVDFSNETFGCH